jgi:hypothetical protein
LALCETFPELEVMHLEIFPMVSHKVLEEWFFTFFYFSFLSLFFWIIIWTICIFVQVMPLLKIAQPFKHLKHLDCIIYLPYAIDEECDFMLILNILQASPLLQKLSVMVSRHD